MTSFEPDRIAHELSQRGLAWADADAAFKALDDVTKTVLSEAIAELNEPDLSVAAAEQRARRSAKYKEHLQALADARKASNRSRVNYDTYKAWVDLLRSQHATERALATLR